MRPFLIAITLFLSVLTATAQIPNDKSVVKDSTGKIYSFMDWVDLVQKDYGIKAVDTKKPDTEFLLYKLSDEAIAAREARKKTFKVEDLPKPRETPFFKTGETFKMFKTTDINGNKIDLKAEKGKIIVLNFWFIDCPPCRKEIPDLNNLVDSFSKNENVLFIGVALDNRSSLKSFLENHPYKYRIIHEGKFLVQNYNINTYPTHLVVDQEGKIYFHTMGLAPNTVYWLTKSINELVKKGEEKTASN